MIKLPAIVKCDTIEEVKKILELKFFMKTFGRHPRHLASSEFVIKFENYLSNYGNVALRIEDDSEGYSNYTYYTVDDYDYHKNYNFVKANLILRPLFVEVNEEKEEKNNC